MSLWLVGFQADGLAERRDGLVSPWPSVHCEVVVGHGAFGLSSMMAFLAAGDGLVHLVSTQGNPKQPVGRGDCGAGGPRRLCGNRSLHHGGGFKRRQYARLELTESRRDAAAERLAEEGDRRRRLLHISGSHPGSPACGCAPAQISIRNPRGAAQGLCLIRRDVAAATGWDRQPARSPSASSGRVCGRVVP